MPMEIRDVSTNTTWLETLSDSLSRGLAGRISRKSFVGRVSRGAVAATLGGAGATLFMTESAEAHANPCANGCSVQCSRHPSWGANSCPSGTCECGCWCISVSTGVCGSGLKEWCDCCGGDFCLPQGCTCISACGTTYPSCCNHKVWAEGCGSADWHIACRYSKCVSSSQCEHINSVCAGAAC